MNLDWIKELLTAYDEKTIIAAVVVAIAAVLAAIIIAHFKIEKKRREGLKQAARRFGFSYTKDTTINIPEQMKSFHLFSQGYGKKVSNLMEGYWEGCDFLIFDYQYTVGAGNSSVTYRQTVARMHISSVAFPQFVLKPAGFFDRMFAGSKAVTFENNAEFSRKYSLTGNDKDRIRKLFSPSVRNVLQKIPKKISIQAQGPYLLYYSRSKRIKPEELRAFIQEASEISQIFSRSVKHI